MGICLAQGITTGTPAQVFRPPPTSTLSFLNLSSLLALPVIQALAETLFFFSSVSHLIDPNGPNISSRDLHLTTNQATMPAKVVPLRRYAAMSIACFEWREDHCPTGT